MVQLGRETHVIQFGRETAQPRWLDADEQQAWRQYLHASRLLEAVMDRDLQAYRAQLTDKGRTAVLQMAPTHVRSVLTDLVEPLPREEFLALGRAMGAVGEGIRGNGASDEVLTAAKQPA